MTASPARVGEGPGHDRRWLAVAIPAVLAYNVFGRLVAASRPTWKAFALDCVNCWRARPAQREGVEAVSCAAQKAPNV